MIKFKLKLAALFLVCSSAFAGPVHSDLKDVNINYQKSTVAYGERIVEQAIGSVDDDTGPVILMCRPWPECLVHQQ